MPTFSSRLQNTPAMRLGAQSPHPRAAKAAFPTPASSASGGPQMAARRLPRLIANPRRPDLRHAHRRPSSPKAATLVATPQAGSNPHPNSAPSGLQRRRPHPRFLRHPTLTASPPSPKEEGICPVCYYVAPQVWASRLAGASPRSAPVVDTLCCVLPF